MESVVCMSPFMYRFLHLVLFQMQQISYIPLCPPPPDHVQYRLDHHPEWHHPSISVKIVVIAEGETEYEDLPPCCTLWLLWVLSPPSPQKKVPPSTRIQTNSVAPVTTMWFSFSTPQISRVAVQLATQKSGAKPSRNKTIRVAISLRLGSPIDT